MFIFISAYLYGFAASDESRKTVAAIRDGEYEGLPGKVWQTPCRNFNTSVLKCDKLMNCYPFILHYYVETLVSEQFFRKCTNFKQSEVNNV